ncbi:protein GLUTAMINE DUMPER 3-like [Durio zibethinus]|uniref:Protein GLUTAMINE DUMPER 3-like n=1 Tax=Durio zibethinus TaxID=66656 RepID=A0A6P5ZGG4_DURZI|nr:protein GLUTAMINE DUMPER 3-like [Durio zibethinus]
MEAREPFNVTGKTTSGVATPHSPWHSPVPYLFGGLAAMLGLIAFALLILACSYWKLSGYLENGEEGQVERDLEAGEGKGDETQKGGGAPVMEQKILVIMAGEAKPTFLATPISSTKSSSFADKSEKGCCCEKGEKSEEEGEKEESTGDDQVQSRSSGTQQFSNQRETREH